MKRILGLVISIFLIVTEIFAQQVITGKILDFEDGKPLQFVNVLLKESNTGNVTDEHGIFRIETNSTSGKLYFHSVGFKDDSLSYITNDGKADLGLIYLKKQSYVLDEITISSGLVKSEKTPVTVSTINAKTIRNELGDRPLTFSLSSIPGVYSARNGGGSGDAEINIRGFSQENVGVLLNGIPINGVENGLIYWSNWLGLSNAAAEIQVQKGPGFANASANSVGGSINIITNPAEKERSGSIIYQVTSYGNQKFNLALNSGKMKNGWSISLLGSYTRGPGYVDATYVRGWSYYLALSKQINPKNKISITILGAPQHHGQRTLKLTNEENSLHGNLYNKDWGSLDGKINNASENFYHRPFIGINHNLQIDKTKKLSNSVYMIMGTGGGKWSEIFNNNYTYDSTIFDFRTHSGQIDWEAIHSSNINNARSYTLQNGTTVNGYSMNVMTDFLASHIETGFLSNYEQRLNRHFKLVAGIHYRYFNSFLREKITDLMGGDFFIEDYGWAVDGVAGRDQTKTVGDIIKVDNNSIINYINAYAQLLFESDKWNAFASVNGNNNWFQRIDRYNYVNNIKSEVIIKQGIDARAGIGFRPVVNHLLYANAAFISKAPYFKYVFGNFTNIPVQNLANEHIKTIEAGYKFENEKVNTNVNGFFTDWENVSILSNEYIQLENNQQSRAMINGLKARHMGIEGMVSARLSGNLILGGTIAIGNYRWKNDVSARLFNNDNVVVDTVNVFVKDLYVGGTAQQQFGLFADLKLLSFLNIKAEWLYFNKIYANFSPTTRNNENDRSQPFQFPSYSTLNIYLGIPFKFFSKTAQFQINGYNILNNRYIEWGDDGINHDLNTFSGFWSFGRTFDFMLRINF